MSVEAHILRAWLSARSVARGVPAPLPDCDGFRVDTNSAEEVVRWVFPKMAHGLANLARRIDQPRHFLKLCGSSDELRAAVPGSWHIHEQRYFMRTSVEPHTRRLPAGYRIEVERTGAVVAARILTTAGSIAASGYAAETPEAFSYDRIATAPEHRRKGLGNAIMTTLHAAKRNTRAIELLVATEEGHALYSTLGWETLSPYSTASILP